MPTDQISMTLPEVPIRAISSRPVSPPRTCRTPGDVLERELGVLRAVHDERRNVDSLDHAVEGHQRRELSGLRGCFCPNTHCAWFTSAERDGHRHVPSFARPAHSATTEARWSATRCVAAI